MTATVVHNAEKDTADKNLQRAFYATLLAKGLSALVETVGGVLLMVITPQQMHSALHTVLSWLTSARVGQSVQTMADQHLTTFLNHGLSFAIVYLLSHGLVKLVLVGAVCAKQRWAYPGLMVALVGFIIYQCWHMIAVSFGVGMLGLTLFDVVVCWLTWREYQRKKKEAR